MALLSRTKSPIAEAQAALAALQARQTVNNERLGRHAGRTATRSPVRRSCSLRKISTPISLRGRTQRSSRLHLSSAAWKVSAGKWPLRSQGRQNGLPICAIGRARGPPKRSSRRSPALKAPRGL